MALLSFQRSISARDTEGNKIDTSRYPGNCVWLNVYDVGESATLHKTNNVSKMLGGGIYHAGVEVFGVEWAYGYTDEVSTGVHKCQPRGAMGHTYRSTTKMGFSKLNDRQVIKVLEKLFAEWIGNEYHFIEQNCLHFASTLCQNLGVGKIPAWVDRYGRTAAKVGGVLSTPIHGMKFAAGLAPRWGKNKEVANESKDNRSGHFSTGFGAGAVHGGKSTSSLNPAEGNGKELSLLKAGKQFKIIDDQPAKALNTKEVDVDDFYMEGLVTSLSLLTDRGRQNSFPNGGRRTSEKMEKCDGVVATTSSPKKVAKPGVKSKPKVSAGPLPKKKSSSVEALKSEEAEGTQPKVLKKSKVVASMAEAPTNPMTDTGSVNATPKDPMTPTEKCKTGKPSTKSQVEKNDCASERIIKVSLDDCSKPNSQDRPTSTGSSSTGECDLKASDTLSWGLPDHTHGDEHDVARTIEVADAPTWNPPDGADGGEEPGVPETVKVIPMFSIATGESKKPVDP